MGLAALTPLILVNPTILEAVLPRLIEVEPKVTELYTNLALAMLPASMVFVTVPVSVVYTPFVTLVALPLKLAVIVPAAKLPLLSRDTMAEAVLELVAVVALLLTLPEVLIQASLVSTIAADVAISAFTILVDRFNLL